jgi:hypothetical protein
MSMRSTLHKRYQIFPVEGEFMNFQKLGQNIPFTALLKAALKMQKPRSPNGDRGQNCRIAYLKGYLSSERQIEIQCSLTADCYGISIKNECVTDNKPTGVNGASYWPATG